MTDELKLRKSVEDAARAQALINNEMLNGAFTTLEETYLKEWHATKATETDLRENIWRAIIVLTHIRLHLRRVLDNGKLAQKELDAMTEGKHLKVVS